MLTPPEPYEFCRIIADARHYKLAGWMDGSAYRHHPCFVFRRNLLLCNEWNTNGYCWAKAFTVNPVKFKPWCHNPAAWGDPTPYPETGQEVRFYWTGRWEVEGPWQRMLLDMLDELRSEITEAKATAATEAARTAAKHKADQDAVIAAAAAAYAP